MSIRDDLIPVVDEIRGSVVDEVAGLRLHTVVVRVRTWSGGRPGLGTATDVDVELAPKPRVRPVPERWINGEGGRYQAGDRTVDRISATYDRADLKPTADTDEQVLYLVDGVEHEIVSGPEEGFLGWQLVVRRKVGKPS